jgi:hypothetical protein
LVLVYYILNKLLFLCYIKFEKGASALASFAYEGLSELCQISDFIPKNPVLTSDALAWTS